MAITDFLSSSISKDDAEVALRVVRRFKACENTNEYLNISFLAWVKLEQLEEFLCHMAEGSPLRDDTLRYIEQERTRNSRGLCLKTRLNGPGFEARALARAWTPRVLGQARWVLRQLVRPAVSGRL